MKHQTKKLAFTSFVLAAMLLLCTLFPLIPIRKSASAQNNPIDSKHRIAYVTQDERTAVPDNFLALNYTQYDKILIPWEDDYNAESTLFQCLSANYDLTILDFELNLYDETILYNVLEQFYSLKKPVILIHAMSVEQVEQASYFQFLTAAISINEWKNDGFEELLSDMAHKIKIRYETSSKLNIFIDYLFYWHYHTDIIERLETVLTNAGIFDFRLIIQLEDKPYDCRFLIVDSHSAIPQTEKTFAYGSAICVEYPDATCGITTSPISPFTSNCFADIFGAANHREFNAYRFVSYFSIHFKGKALFPSEIVGTDAVVNPEDVDKGLESDDEVPQWLEDKRAAFGEYLLNVMNDIFSAVDNYEEPEQINTYFLYI